MLIRGSYRDVLTRGGVAAGDRGWRRNAIAADLGSFMASLMKKRFTEQVGIEYMAVGNGSGAPSFRDRVAKLFESGDPARLAKDGDLWVYAKKIDKADIRYLDAQDVEVAGDAVTNRLGIRVVFGKGDPPADEVLDFREFALLGVDKEFRTNKLLFLINYVAHGTIAKDRDMELSRTVRLWFPIGEG